jgi:RNA polymerase sigma factor (TIGR02999 family)
MSSDLREPDAPADLLAVYDALRELAAQRLAAERPDHTLQATALVHEVYLKLAGEDPGRWKDSGHFFHAAAEAMRRTLVDYARARARLKRGGNGLTRVPLTEAVSVATLAEGADPEEVLSLDAAVSKLERISPDVVAVIRLRFYGGLTVAQTAEALNVSMRTVNRKWLAGQAWLYREMTANQKASHQN